MREIIQNNLQGVLKEPLDASRNSITLELEPGHDFPDLVQGREFYRLTITESSGVESVWEVVRVVAKTGDVLTIDRGFETAISDWPAGSLVDHRITAGMIKDAQFNEDRIMTINGEVAVVEETGNIIVY